MISRIKFLICFLASLLTAIHLCVGQDTEEYDDDISEFWLDVNLNKALGDRWSVGGDVGVRTSFDNSIWRLIYLRPNVNYKFLPFFNVTVGIGSFNTFSNEFSDTYELRFYQDANFRGPKLGPFNFLHRIRFEQRFFHFSADELENDFSFRGRYLIGANSERFSLGGKKDWSAYLSLEPFFPLGKEVSELLANNFRWDTALVYNVSDNFRIELHYIHQTSKLFSDSDLNVREHIFRIRVFQRL